MGFEPMTFGFPWRGRYDRYPMSPTLHQAEPPRQVIEIGLWVKGLFDSNIITLRSSLRHRQRFPRRAPLQVPMNILAYDERLSTKRLWPSAYRVSKASEDLPLPDSPVRTTSLSRGIVTSIFFKLLTFAPLMTIFLDIFTPISIIVEPRLFSQLFNSISYICRLLELKTLCGVAHLGSELLDELFSLES